MNVVEKIPNFDNQLKSEQVASPNQYFSDKWYEIFVKIKAF